VSVRRGFRSGSSSSSGPRGADAVLDGGDQLDDVGRPRKDADGLVGLVLDEPLAGRREDSGVQQPPTDQDGRPGASLGDRGIG
jgi:hypothetical protein